MRTAGLSRIGAVALFTLAGSIACVGTASALEPGVHIDPGSPAAKEYALPLSQARQNSGQSSSGSEAVFGAGITPPRSGGKPSGGSGSRGARDPRRGAPSGRGAPGAAPAQPLPAAVLRAARPRGSSGGGSSLLVLLGGGVAILVLGGFGGTVLRHSRRPTPSGIDAG